MSSSNQNILASVNLFPSQIEQAWDQVGKILLPTKLRSPSNIVLVGMGGSGLPGEIVKDLEFSLLKRPFEIVNGYHLPAYVTKETLVILTSYSGDTEEVMSCAWESVKKTQKIFAFATGGRLTQFALAHNITLYDLVPVFNPSNLPRLSLGYSLTMLLSLLAKLDLLKLNSRTINSLSKFLKKERGDQLAQKLARTLNDRLPVLVSGAHLVGATSAARNMFHETAKTFAVSYPIPELNHHLLESLSFPKILTQRLTFIILASKHYHPEIKRRFKLTMEVLDKRHIEWETVQIPGESPLADACWEIQFFGLVSYYLSELYGIDPGATPWVDWFKEQLK